jgi:hypothetical protein
LAANALSCANDRSVAFSAAFAALAESLRPPIRHTSSWIQHQVSREAPQSG